MKKLQNKIMRGIYYAYAIRVATIPGVWQGFVMLGVMIVLTRFVSLGNVLSNLERIELGQVGTFIYNAFRTTEIWTLLLVGILVFLALSIRFTLTPRGDSYTFART